MSVAIMRLPQVKQRTGLSRSSIYSRVATGDFPAPIHLGPRARGWLETEVDAWISHRIAITRTDKSEATQ
jgi:prophage regulatory protein